MTPLAAVYDACVLYPAPLRDLLVRLALAGLVRAHWSERIHDEWTRSVLANRPELSSQSIERCRRLMDAHSPDAVVTGYAGRIAALELPDPDDRHVLAAALECGAAVIVTFNRKDFPPAKLGPLAVEAVHPDEFVMRLLDEDSRAVCGGGASPAALPSTSRRKRWMSSCRCLGQCGLPRSVTVLRSLAELL